MKAVEIKEVVDNYLVNKDLEKDVLAIKVWDEYEFGSDVLIDLISCHNSEHYHKTEEDFLKLVSIYRGIQLEKEANKHIIEQWKSSRNYH